MKNGYSIALPYAVDVGWQDIRTGLPTFVIFFRSTVEVLALPHRPNRLYWLEFSLYEKSAEFSSIFPLIVRPRHGLIFTA